MGAIMGGTMRSPLTGVIFSLELTHDWNALPALFVGNMAALGVTVLLLRRSILTEKLARRGHHIAREYSVDLFELTRVGEVMDAKPLLIPERMTIREFSDRIIKNDSAAGLRHGALIVDNEQKLAGIITRNDVLRALCQDPVGATRVLDIAATNLVVTFPDESLHDAIAKLLKHNIGRLPVVKREDASQVVGYLGRAEILAVRLRHHKEEEFRDRFSLLSRLKWRSDRVELQEVGWLGEK
jgi:CBS domain-containing protein